MPTDIENTIKSAMTSGFWGQIQIDFQNGQPVVIRKQQTFKIDENNNREKFNSYPRR